MLRDLGTCARASGLRFPANCAPILALMLATSCVPTSQPLWPALTGELTAASRSPYVPAATGTDWPYELSLSDGVFQPVRLSPAPAGGGRIGEQLRDLRTELASVARFTAGSNRRLQLLRSTAVGRSEVYVAIVERIDSTLSANPAPADPALQRLWRQALSALDRVASDDPALDRLIDRVAGEGEAATEITEGLRSGIDLSEATDAERAVRDELLRDAEAAAETSAAMLADAKQDLATKQGYISAERANLQIMRLAIANGESYGISLANRSMPDLSGRTDQPAQPRRGDSPLVVIRFDNDQTRYAQPLYRAASLALERRADALFTVVAVAPAEATIPASAYADAVRQTLSEMGLSAGQLFETSWIDSAAIGAEVHLYVR